MCTDMSVIIVSESRDMERSCPHFFFFFLNLHNSRKAETMLQSITRGSRYMLVVFYNYNDSFILDMSIRRTF